MLRLQLGRILRFAEALDELGRCAGDAAQMADAARDQARIAQIPDAHGGVDPFLNQIDHPVVHAHLHADLGVLGDETGQRGHDDASSQRNRDFDT